VKQAVGDKEREGIDSELPKETHNEGGIVSDGWITTFLQSTIISQTLSLRPYYYYYFHPFLVAPLVVSCFERDSSLSLNNPHHSFNILINPSTLSNCPT
jgi:hypothetical protein